MRQLHLRGQTCEVMRSAVARVCMNSNGESELIEPNWGVEGKRCNEPFQQLFRHLKLFEWLQLLRTCRYHQ